MSKVMLLCGSMKPYPGQDSRSFTRDVLNLATQGLTDQGFTDYQVIDINELDLPSHAGLRVQEYNHPDVDRLVNAFVEAEHIIVSVPAYWRVSSGAFLNAINLVVGPLYDYAEGEVSLKGKTLHLIVTGVEHEDAVQALSQLRNTFASMGATVARKALVIGNVRNIPEDVKTEVFKESYQIGRSIASWYINESARSGGSI